MNINKKQALEKLEQLRVEFAKKGKELEDIINTPEKDWRNVKSFEDACEFLDLDSDEIENKWKYGYLTGAQITALKLELCIKAINEGWKPNWKDLNQSKWYNWLEFKNGGWFLDCSSDVRGLYSSLGCNFYYESEEKAKFGANHFKHYYDIWLG